MEQPVEWQLEFCAGYIVPVCKGTSESEIEVSLKGSTVTLDDELHRYFLPIFRAAPDYPVDIVFESDDQNHPIRNLLREIAFGDPDVQGRAARKLASKLAAVTDNRSEEGLLIITLGVLSAIRRIAIWKFPSDDSIRATFADNGLTVELIEDAFSKDSKYFKAAVFEGSTDASFWTGKVEDRQATNRINKVSDLWLEGFLSAKVELKDSVASKKVGDALRKTIGQLDDLALQERVVAVATSLPNQDGDLLTYREVSRRLPGEARQPFLAALKDSRIDIPFTLQADVIERATRFRTIVLDNGFSVHGPASMFDAHQTPIEIEQIEGNLIRITIQGRKIEDKLGVR